MSPVRDWLQFLLLYVGGPLVAYGMVRVVPWTVISLILLAGIGSWIALLRFRRRPAARRAAACRPDVRSGDPVSETCSSQETPTSAWILFRGRGRPGPELLRIGIVWLSAAVVLGSLTWHHAPELWLGFPRQAPLFWALVMVLYPPLSALPQEVFFRAWFFERFERLFPRSSVAVPVNAVLFGAAHVVMENWIAVGATIPLGLLLAWTYRRTRSLLLVWIEHSLYGGLVFTLGLGLFFIPAERLGS